MVLSVNVILYILYSLSLFFAIAVIKVIILGSSIFSKKWQGILLYLFGFISFTALFIMSFLLLNSS